MRTTMAGMSDIIRVLAMTKFGRVIGRHCLYPKALVASNPAVGILYIHQVILTNRQARRTFLARDPPPDVRFLSGRRMVIIFWNVMMAMIQTGIRHTKSTRIEWMRQSA